MTTWFVTRHDGAVAWAGQCGLITEGNEVRVVSEISPEQVAQGDRVIGNLPIHLAAELCKRGGRYFHISMEVPSEMRGKELSSEDMVRYGAQCREFIILPGGDAAQAPVAERASGSALEEVHVCLVSDQYMANLLPILKRRPAQIELVCTPEMLLPGGGLERLAGALQHFGYGDQCIFPHAVDSACATDFHLGRQAARRLRDGLVAKYPGRNLVLNNTGGTKILATAFFVEFQGCQIIYTDTQGAGGNSIRFLDSASRPAEHIGKQISRIEDYLFCQGYKTQGASKLDQERERVVGRRSRTTSFIVGRPNHFCIRELNRVANEIKSDVEKAVKNEINRSQVRTQAERDAIRDKHIDAQVDKVPIKKLKAGHITERFVRDGLLTASADSYHFADSDAVIYFSGGWLEEWAWSVARRCQPDDCAMNVTVIARGADGVVDDRKVDNELDLVILHNNRLLIAECKTIDWGGGNAKQEVFNKLDALGTHARGLFGRSFLISALELDGLAARRAASYGIQVLQSQGLMDLEGAILEWMGKPLPEKDKPEPQNPR